MLLFPWPEDGAETECDNINAASDEGEGCIGGAASCPEDGRSSLLVETRRGKVVRKGFFKKHIRHRQEGVATFPTDGHVKPGRGSNGDIGSTDTKLGFLVPRDQSTLRAQFVEAPYLLCPAGVAFDQQSQLPDSSMGKPCAAPGEPGSKGARNFYTGDAHLVGSRDQSAGKTDGTGAVHISFPIRRCTPRDNFVERAPGRGVDAYGNVEDRLEGRWNIQIPHPGIRYMVSKRGVALAAQHKLQDVCEGDPERNSAADGPFIPQGSRNGIGVTRNEQHTDCTADRTCHHADEERAGSELLRGPSSASANTKVPTPSVQVALPAKHRRMPLSGPHCPRDLLGGLQIQSVTSSFKDSGLSRLAAQIARAKECGSKEECGKGRSNYMFLTHRLAEAPTSRIKTYLTDGLCTFTSFNQVKVFMEDEKEFLTLFKPGLAPSAAQKTAKGFVQESPWSISRGLLLHLPALQRMGLGDTVARAIFVSKWFPVAKDETFFRLITALKPLNQRQRKPPTMDLPAVHSFMERLLRCNWVLQFDAKSYFFQFALNRAIALYFAALATGNRGLAVLIVLWVLAMGWSFAPCIAQRFANGVCLETLLRCKQCEAEAVAWVDNFGLGSANWTATCKLRDTFLTICDEFGLTLKPSELAPTQEFIALGMVFQLQNKTIRLADKFLIQLSEATKLRKEKPTARTFFVAMGGIFWSVFTTTRKALCFYPRLVQFLRTLSGGLQRGLRSWDEVLDIPSDVEDELTELEGVILSNEPIFYADLIAPDEPLATLWADASETAAGFVLEYEGYDICWGSCPFPSSIKGSSIYFKEMWAAAESLWISSLMLNHIKLGCGLVYAGDNQAVINSIRKGHARSNMGNFILARVFRATGGRTLHQAWVDTHTERADPLTRGQSLPRAASVPAETLRSQFTIVKKR